MNLAIADTKLPSQITLRNLRVLFDRTKDLKMDVVSWGHLEPSRKPSNIVAQK